MREILRAFAACSVLVSCLGCSAVPKNPAITMTVLTYNIHHGKGTDGKLDLARIARTIHAQQPDLVALQEVDQNARRSDTVDQAAELARILGMNHVFGKAMDFQGGAYGQAILSKWPIKLHQVHPLPQRPGREPRIVLTALIAAPGMELIFASTHFDHQFEEIRIEQAAAVNDIFSAYPGAKRALLVGDFNAFPESKTMAALSVEWADTAGKNAAPTIPAASPSRRIDYILVRPRTHWTILHSRVVNEPTASDHRPVLVTLELR